MKRPPRHWLILLIATSCVLVSCSTMRKAGDASLAAMKTTTSAAMSKISDLPMGHLLPGQGPKVVEVREKDLKELPSGQELAKAHQQQKSAFWFFGGPVDIPEPVLPEPGTEMDGSLLPPPVH